MVAVKECPECLGRGFFYEKVLDDTLYGEYLRLIRICKECSGGGKVQK